MFQGKEFATKDGRSITVRLAKPGDYDETIETFAEVASEKVYLNTESISPDIKKVWTERWVRNGENTLFAIVESGGRIVGGMSSFWRA